MKCRVCEEDKSDDKFYKTNKYRRLVCRKCENRRMTIWKRKRSRELKIAAVKHYGGCCSICGYKKCIHALEFDHQGIKKSEPAKLIQGSTRLEQILPELDTCVLICANCHRERHFNESV